MHISKDDEDTISKFVKGLSVDIKKRVLLQIVATHEYWNVIKVALKVKMQMKRHTERKQALKRFERV